MKRYSWFAAAAFLRVSLIFAPLIFAPVTCAQGVGTENNGAGPGGNRTSGTPPDTPDGHVVATPKNPGEVKGEVKKVKKARKVKSDKLDPKIVERARATPEHGANAVPSAPPVTDPHEQPAK
jgi:hypothetical protein